LALPIEEAPLRRIFWVMTESAYSLLEGTTGKQSLLAPGRAARRWMNVTTDSGREMNADKIAARRRFNPDLAIKLYDTITPGTTVVLAEHAVAAVPIR
jgi:hypothetical protein